MKPIERFDDDARNPEIELALRMIAAMIQGGVPPGWGWGVIVVPFDDEDPSAVFYVSNTERPGMVDAVKVWIADSEQRQRERH